MFVLDTSGSIGDDNFDSVRDYVKMFVDEFDIGLNDNQVGVITFSTSAMLEFNLNTYTNSDPIFLKLAINRIIYSRRESNIPDALCELITAFSSPTSGARFDVSIFRIALFMTDGESIRNSNPCNYQNVSDASRAVHNATPPILVYALGVGSEFNQEELSSIASGPEYLSTIESFSTSDLNCARSMQKDDICYSSKLLATGYIVNYFQFILGEKPGINGSRRYVCVKQYTTAIG